jgi:Arc/MetJ family transcription regulator
MKMTLDIDGNVVAEVSEAYGFDTKTEAVNFAL